MDGEGTKSLRTSFSVVYSSNIIKTAFKVCSPSSSMSKPLLFVWNFKLLFSTVTVAQTLLGEKMSTIHKQNRWWIQIEASNVTIRSFSKPFFPLCTRPILNWWLLYVDSLLTVVWTLTHSQFHFLPNIRSPFSFRQLIRRTHTHSNSHILIRWEKYT